MNENSHSNIPKVYDYILKNDLCIGCGLCVYACPSDALQMTWNKTGFLNPVLINKCDNDGSCIKFCPFNPYPERQIETENELSVREFSNASNRNKQLGAYEEIYVGYSNEFRTTSSSGGLATYIMQQLFEKEIVDAIITVKDGLDDNRLYDYSIISSKSEVLSASKSRYYPVSLAEVLNNIESFNGKIALVGVGCFIKAIRIAQYYKPEIKQKIVFTIGIICGGLKSRSYTEYLSSKVGVHKSQILTPEYRVKDYSSTATDYSYSCVDALTKKKHSFKMREVGDMWGTGLFKANACDLCDDVTTELADISLGDAWLQPFDKDGKGNNVIVVRSKIATELIYHGIKTGSLSITELSLERFLQSQQGSFNHKHKGLAIRMKLMKDKGLLIPPKRDWSNYKSNFAFEFVQYYRMKIRRKSLEEWRKVQSFDLYSNNINFLTLRLRRVTVFYHFVERLSSLTINKIMNKLRDQIF